jgi:hypothetical protein
MKRVIFEVVGGSPDDNRRLAEMFSRAVAKRLSPQKLWQCRCDCGEILGSGYQKRINLARVVPHCEGIGMRWELQSSPEPKEIE